MSSLQTNVTENIRFMDATAEFAASEFERHTRERADRNPRSYHDILTREVVHELTGLTPLEAEPDIQQIFVGNLLVENGIPEYDRVSSETFELQEDYRSWKNTWVSEEAYHGPSMQEWAAATSYVSIDEVHERTQGYLRNGLTLNFPTLFHALAYPALQEPATKMTHSEVMRSLPKSKESLQAEIGRSIMGLIIADERAHETFYTNMVRLMLETEDMEIVSGQMIALADAVLGFSMPGIEKDIPDGAKITSAYKRTGVFTFDKLAKDILLPAIGPTDKYNWQIEKRVGLNNEAELARDLMVKFVEDLLTADEGRMGRIIIRARRERGLMAVR